MSVTADITIKHAHGLHTRSASAFVKTANGFRSQIAVENLTKCTEKANAKSILSVLGISVVKVNTVSIQADGPDEHAALDARRNLITSDFDAA